MRCKWINNTEYSDLKGKSILVAGGTGFIGKRAKDIFRELGMNVYIISRKEHTDEDGIRYGKADLNDIGSLRSIFPDIQFDHAVYMAANIPLRGAKKENYYDAKLSTFDPFINFCEVFLPRTGRFVYISSVDVLGGCPQCDYDESAPVRIATPYGLAKYVGEFYTRDICESLKIPYSILRFSQVYGPDEPVVRIIPIIRKAMLEGTEFTLVTDGSERRRFLYVDDAVKAIVHGLIYAGSEIYNIAGPDVISMKDLVSLIEDTWGIPIRLTVKGEIRGEDNLPSYAKAEREIHYEPDVDMTQGMKNVMEEEQC